MFGLITISKLKFATGALIFFAFFGFFSQAKAGDVAIGGDAQFVNITPYVDYYEDATGALGIEDVASGRIYSEFIPVRRGAFHAGLSGSTYWFRVRLGISQSVGWGNKWLLEIPKLNTGEVCMYVPDFTKPGGYDVERAPSLFSDYDKPLSFRNTVFPISASMGGKTIFFKVKSQWPVSIPFYVWEDGAYRKEVTKRAIVFALACGLMLGAAVFSLFALSGRSWKMVGLFIVFILFWQAFLFNVRGYSLLFFNNPSVLYQSTDYILSGMGVAGVLLTIQLLSLRLHTPGLYRVGLSLLGLLALGILLSFVLPQSVSLKLIAAIMILAGIYKLCASTVRAKQGSRSAFWYLLACIILYGGVALSLCNGVFWPDIPITQNFLILGTSLASVFMCLAIAVEYGMQELKRIAQNDRIGDLDPYDISTGLYSQAYFVSRFTEEINHCHRVQQPLSLLLIDLDHLRKVNEKYGVLFSDQVIVALGEIIKENALRFSAGGRLGGGHFALQLSEVPLKDALDVAEKIRNEFSNIKFSTSGYIAAPVNTNETTLENDDSRHESEASALNKENIQFTVCIGVVEVLPDETRFEEVIKRAEAELEKAKELGVNNIYPDPSIRDLL